MNDSINSSSACTAAGGSWKSRAKTKAECEAVTGCCEPGNMDCRFQMSPKDAQQCAACGGQIKSAYSWCK